MKSIQISQISISYEWIRNMWEGERLWNTNLYKRMKSYLSQHNGLNQKPSYLAKQIIPKEANIIYLLLYFTVAKYQKSTVIK